MSDTPGNFSQTEKDKIFLSRQTYEGLQITVPSTMEAVKYVLIGNRNVICFNQDVRFNQDALEEYFGRH